MTNTVTNLIAPVLAEGDDFVKVIIGIVVFIIWGIGALANMAKKQGQASQRSREEMERAMLQQMEEARRRQMAGALEEMGGSSRPAVRPPPPPLPPVVPQQQRPRPRGPSVPPMRALPPAPPAPPPRGARRPFESLGGTRTMPATPQAVPAMRQQQPQQRKKAQKRRAPVAAPALPVAVPELMPETPGVLESEIGQGSTPASPTRRQTASSVFGRLDAQTLRQQFILTELLQPPLALRERAVGGSSRHSVFPE